MDSNGNTPPSRCSDGGLPIACKPKCFGSLEQWDEYRELWRLSHRHCDQTPQVNFCKDCSPEYRDQMIEQDRCAHPETVFIIHADGQIGVNGDRWGAWVSAISGRWPVVSQPKREHRDAFIRTNKRE